MKRPVSIGLDPRRPGIIPASNAPAPENSFSAAGRTLVDPATITGRVVNIVFLGQSTNNNSIIGTYTPDHGDNVFNLSPLTGGNVYLAGKPLLASDLVEDHHGRWLADMLIDNDLVDNVILTMAAHGGSLAADWMPGGGLYGVSNTRPGSLAWRIGEAARCIYAAGLDAVPRILDWQQGEADTSASTTQANMETALTRMILECRNTGLLRPNSDVMFVHKCTRPSGTTMVKDAIRAAQAAVCDGVVVREGADIDSITGSENRPDGTHFSMTGAAAQAALKLAVYENWL